MISSLRPVQCRAEILRFCCENLDKTQKRCYTDIVYSQLSGLLKLSKYIEVIIE